MRLSLAAACALAVAIISLSAPALAVDEEVQLDGDAGGRLALGDVNHLC